MTERHESVTSPDRRCCSAVLGWQDAQHAWNQPDPRRGADPRRASVASTSYTVDLDLTSRRQAPSVARPCIRFTCAEPGASTFADLVGAHHPRDHAQRRAARPRPTSYARQPDPLDRPRRPTTSCGWSPTALQPHRRGPAPLRRPGRRPGLPLHASSRCRTRAACSPPSSSPTSRRRSPSPSPRPRTGWSSPTRRRPTPGAGRATATRGVALPDRPSGCRPTSPRSSPVSTTRCTTPTRASTATIPLGPLLPAVAGRAPRRRRALRGHQAGLRVLRGGLRLSRTRSASTTSSSCRSTTWARWRTPAA